MRRLRRYGHRPHLHLAVQEDEVNPGEDRDHGERRRDDERVAFQEIREAAAMRVGHLIRPSWQRWISAKCPCESASSKVIGPFVLVQPRPTSAIAYSNPLGRSIRPR